MNPLTNMKTVKKLSEQELHTTNKSSWHDQYKNSAWIFVGGLPYDLSEGDVICIFSQFGEIVNLNLVRDKESGKPKGFCFICYEDQRSTVLAVDNFNGIKILKRIIRVDHVQDYKVPKDTPKLDEITRLIQNEGCGPGSTVLLQQSTQIPHTSKPILDEFNDIKLPERLPIYDNIKKENEERVKKKRKDKKKKEKKKYKTKKKLKKKKRKSSSSSSSSESENEDNSDNSTDNNKKKKMKKVTSRLKTNDLESDDSIYENREQRHYENFGDSLNKDIIKEESHEYKQKPKERENIYGNHNNQNRDEINDRYNSKNNNNEKLRNSRPWENSNKNLNHNKNKYRDGSHERKRSHDSSRKDDYKRRRDDNRYEKDEREVYSSRFNKEDRYRN